MAGTPARKVGICDCTQRDIGDGERLVAIGEFLRVGLNSDEHINVG